MARADARIPWHRRILPNHVTSLGGVRRSHRIEPFAAEGDPGALLRRLERVVSAMPRTEIAAAGDGRLQAVCRTRRGFPDDVEFWTAEQDGVVHVRSASRFGIFDFGVNRKRVERIREALRAGDARG